MALNFKICAAACKAMCDALVALCNTGGTGTLEIRTGAPPTNTADADSGTKLGTLTPSATAFGAATTATPSVATANAIGSDTNADASGDAGHFRWKNGAGTVVFQGTAGESGDTPDMVFDEKSIVATGTIACSSFTVSVPAA